MSNKNQDGNRVLKQIVAKHFTTRPDKIEITSASWDEQNRQVIFCKCKGYPYKIIRKDGAVRMCFRVV